MKAEQAKVGTKLRSRVTDGRSAMQNGLPRDEFECESELECHQAAEPCQRCDSGDPVVARVTSEFINVAVCQRCADIARGLASHGMGAIQVTNQNS